MSAPGNTPDSPHIPIGCPRLADGANGPRRCELVCRFRLGTGGGRGPSSPRLRLVLLADDTCSRDVAARAKAHGVQLTFREIGVLEGARASSIQATAKVALVKLAKALGAKNVRALLGKPSQRKSSNPAK